MKCPKCNYTSFDYLDKCGKCGLNLAELRIRCGFSPEKGEGLDFSYYMSLDDRQSSPEDSSPADQIKDTEVENFKDDIGSEEILSDDDLIKHGQTEEQTLPVENIEVIDQPDTLESAVKDDLDYGDFTIDEAYSPSSFSKEEDIGLALEANKGFEFDNVEQPDLLSAESNELVMELDVVPTLADLDEVELVLDDRDIPNLVDPKYNSTKLKKDNDIDLDNEEISLDDIDNLSLDNDIDLDNKEISLDDIGDITLDDV
ncbi:MAG: hypothetical protein ABIJ24_05400 [Nitrospinota bacterium]|nr:hypothetical protein [Nitrospinota bacterium]